MTFWSLYADRLFQVTPSLKRLASANLPLSWVVSEAAVKSHLLNLYDEFQIYDTRRPRRVRLAQEALRRRAVTLAAATSWLRSRLRPVRCHPATMARKVDTR